MTDPDQLPALSERSVIRQFLIDYWESDGDQSMAHSMIFAPSDFEAVRRCVSSFAQQVDWLQQQCDERAELKAKLETAEASLLSAKQPLRAEMAALNKRVTEQNSEILSLRTAIATERARADALEAALSDVLRELIADAERPWVALAYARLGAVRDRMDPHNVEAVQEFLGPLDASKG